MKLDRDSMEESLLSVYKRGVYDVAGLWVESLGGPAGIENDCIDYDKKKIRVPMADFYRFLIEKVNRDAHLAVTGENLEFLNDDSLQVNMGTSKDEMMFAQRYLTRLRMVGGLSQDAYIQGGFGGRYGFEGQFKKTVFSRMLNPEPEVYGLTTLGAGYPEALPIPIELQDGSLAFATERGLIMGLRGSSYTISSSAMSFTAFPNKSFRIELRDLEDKSIDEVITERLSGDAFKGGQIDVQQVIDNFKKLLEIIPEYQRQQEAERVEEAHKARLQEIRGKVEVMLVEQYQAGAADQREQDKEVMGKVAEGIQDQASRAQDAASKYSKLLENAFGIPILGGIIKRRVLGKNPNALPEPIPTIPIEPPDLQPVQVPETLREDAAKAAEKTNEDPGKYGNDSTASAAAVRENDDELHK